VAAKCNYNVPLPTSATNATIAATFVFFLVSLPLVSLELIDHVPGFENNSFQTVPSHYRMNTTMLFVLYDRIVRHFELYLVSKEGRQKKIAAAFLIASR